MTMRTKKVTFTISELLELHEIAKKEVRKEFSRKNSFQDKINEINQELGMIKLLNVIFNATKEEDKDGV